MGNDRNRGNGTGENRPSGKYWYEEGWTPLSDEVDRRIFTSELSPANFLILLCLSRDVWLKRRLTIAASHSYIAGKTCIPERTVNRLLGPKGQLRQLGFLRLSKRGCKWREEPNEYFVEPVLIWSGRWDDIGGIELARVLIRDPRTEYYEVKNRQNGGNPEETAKMAVDHRQNGGFRSPSQARETAKMAVSTYQIYPEGMAQCVIATNRSESGEVIGPRNERCPNGLDPKQDLEGIAFGDDIDAYDNQLKELRKARKKGAITEETFKLKTAEITKLITKTGTVSSNAEEQVSCPI